MPAQHFPVADFYQNHCKRGIQIIGLSIIKTIFISIINHEKAVKAGKFVIINFFCQFNGLRTLITLLPVIKKINNDKLIEQNLDLSVQRCHPVEYELEGISFQKSIVQYPLLLYKLSSFEVLVEIIIKEKQKAVGLQPMLYVCFPVTKLQTAKEPLIGRCAEKKETAYLILDKNHKEFVLQTFKIFALLSQSHKSDVISIISLILK